MALPHPATFYPELTDGRLRVLAVELLNLRFLTIRSMNSEFDDNYTREGTVFGRSKNMLVALALSGEHDWLTLAHAGMDVTVNIGHARVQPGDILRGDADGVIVIPAEHEQAVLDAAEEIHAAEMHIREAVRRGMRLDEARRELGYHQLQTRRR